MEQIYEKLKALLPQEEIKKMMRDDVVGYYGSTLVALFHQGHSEYSIYERVSDDENFLQYLWEDIQDEYGDIIDEIFSSKDDKYLLLNIHKDIKSYLVETIGKIKLI